MSYTFPAISSAPIRLATAACWMRKPSCSSRTSHGIVSALAISTARTFTYLLLDERQEPSCPFVRRRLEELLRRRLFDDATVVHHQDRARDMVREAQLV